MMNNTKISLHSLTKETGKNESQGAANEAQPVQLQNSNVTGEKDDKLYHLGLGKKSHDLPAMFGDVKFVCMGGTPRRAEQFAQLLVDELGLIVSNLPTKDNLTDISQRGGRFALYKVGPVLSVSHGMGMASISILLHELIKLMNHAEVKDPKFFRMGTCGGLGIEPGTVVLSEIVVDPTTLQSTYDVSILGKIVKRPSTFNEKFLKEVQQFAQKNNPGAFVCGKTMCTSDFYEGQGRLDGAFCDFTEEQKMEYLKHLKDEHVVNIEMESAAFAALTKLANIDSVVLCVAIVDRLKGDQILVSKEELDEWMMKPLKLVAKYIKEHLQKPTTLPPVAFNSPLLKVDGNKID